MYMSYCHIVTHVTHVTHVTRAGWWESAGQMDQRMGERLAGAGGGRAETGEAAMGYWVT